MGRKGEDKVRLILDMDEVIVDMMNPLLRIYNKKHQANLSIEDIKEWGLPPEMKEIYKTKGFFVELPPLPGAIEGTRYLSKRHDVYIATSPSEDGDIAKEKMTWISLWLPKLMPKLIITHDKSVIKGDAIVDDCLDHIKYFNGIRIVMDRPWNRDYDMPHIRLESFDAIVGLVTRMNPRGIKCLAKGR